MMIEVTAVASEDAHLGEPVLIEGTLTGSATVAVSRENEVRFRVVTGTRWNARLRRDVPLPDVVVFVDLERVECPSEVLMGAAGKVRVLGHWRDFGPWRPDGGPAQDLKEVVADLVELQA